jgi:hypothetical protein
LLIGEKLETGAEPTTKDQKHNKETPQEELEKLEHEDELRVEHLHGKSCLLVVMDRFRALYTLSLQRKCIVDVRAPSNCREYANKHQVMIRSLTI